MATAHRGGKLYDLFTVSGAFLGGRANPVGEKLMVGAIAIALFVAVFAFGAKYFGWDDPDGHVRLALVTTFILGLLSGYKARS
jgi:hypothetical protein